MVPNDKLKDKNCKIVKGQHVLCVCEYLLASEERRNETQLGIQSENH